METYTNNNTNIAATTAPDRIKELALKFHSNEAIVVPIGEYPGESVDKKPMRKWKTVDKTNLNLDINWNGVFHPNSELIRVALGFNNNIEDKIVVLDIDTTDEATLAFVRTLLTDNNGKIIAYPTRKGAHLWFKIPEEVEDGKWWSGRKVGYVTKSGVGPVDYLNGGLINVGLMSKKTGQMELLIDTDKYTEEEINQDMQRLFQETNFKSLDFSWEVFKSLPALPLIAWPLKKPKTGETIEDIKFSTGAGRNTEAFTQWAGMLNMNSELDDDPTVDMEEILEWMNDNLTGNAWFEDLDAVIQSVQGYDNDHCFEPYRTSGKNRKERKERGVKHIEEVIDLSNKEVDWDHYFRNIKTTSRIDNAEFLIEALDVRLLSGTTLVLRKGQRDIVDSRIVAAAILNTRAGFWTQKFNKQTEEMEDVYISFPVDVKWAESVMKAMVAKLNYMITVENQYQYIAEYVTKPLWVDKNGLVIDPFNLLNEEGKFQVRTRLEAGIDREVVPFHLNLDFTKLASYNQESYNLLHKWIMNGVGNNQEKFNYFFKYYGYTFMVGNKFTRQIGLIGGVTASGKSSLEDIIAKTVVGPGNTGLGTKNLFDGKFGLEPIAGKTRGVLDEGSSAFEGNSEDLKRITATTTTLVNPKGSPAFEAFIPKITVLFNDLPESLNYSDPAVLNRLAMVYLENPLTDEFNSETFNTLMNYGGEAFFLHVLNMFKGATTRDIATADKADFWKSPFQGILLDHIEQGYVSEFFAIEKLINNSVLRPEGKNLTTLKKEILALEFEIEARKFVQDNRNNLGRALRALGYRNNTADKSWTK